MNKSHISHFVIFVLGMSIAGIVGLVIVSADTNNGTQDAQLVSKDLAAIDLITHDHDGENHSDEEAGANQNSYALEEWGVSVSGVVINQHQYVTDVDVRFETAVEQQLRGITDADERAFNACVRPLLTLSRIAEADTTTDLKATPWWTVKQELDVNAKKIGDYYYFFKPSTTDCNEDYRLIESITEPLFQEQSAIIKGLNGA